MNLWQHLEVALLDSLPIRFFFLSEGHLQAGCFVTCSDIRKKQQSKTRDITRGNLSGTENRTIRRVVGLESPEIPQREANNESNRSEVESRKTDSESESESHPNNA